MYKLTRTDVENLMVDNKYLPTELAQKKFRDSFGRVEERNNDAAAVVTPGGAVGEMVVALATVIAYGLSADKEAVIHTLTEHFTEFSPVSKLYLQNLQQNFTEFSLDKTDLKLLNPVLKTVDETDITWSGGVVMLKGQYAVHPYFRLSADQARLDLSIPILHRGFVSQQRRKLAKLLITSKAIALNEDDDEYLYEVMSDTAENHWYLSTRLCCKGLPLFAVSYSQKDEIIVEELGDVT